MKTSLKLSQWLKERGFEGKSHRPMDESYWVNQPNGGLQTNGYKWQLENGLRTKHNSYTYLRAYDILNDLCVRYCREIWGADEIYTTSANYIR